MNRVLLFLLFFFTHLEAINLPAALERTAERSPALKAAALEIDSTVAVGWQENLYPNPELTVELDSFGGRQENCGFDSAEISYSVTQLFLLGGKRGARQQLNAARSCLAEWDYTIVEQNLFNDLIHAFVIAYVAQEKLDLASAQLEVARQGHECTQGKLLSGKATALQEKKAILNVHSGSTRIGKAQSAFIAAKQHLASFWQDETPDFDRLEFPFFQFIEPPPVSELEALLVHNPDLAKARTAVNAGLAATVFEDTMRVPDLEVTAGIETARDFSDQDFFLSFSIPLPIFNRNQGNRARASYQAWQAAYAQENLELGLRNDLKRLHRAWNDSYNYARSCLEFEQLMLETAQLAEVSYRQGKIERQEWLDMKRAWLDTKEQSLDAAAEYHLQKADTLRLTAQLKECYVQ